MTNLRTTPQVASHRPCDRTARAEWATQASLLIHLIVDLHERSRERPEVVRPPP